MRSIKEKAEEYSYIDKVIDSDGKVLYINYSLPKRNAFEQGANYVLDHLSKTIAVSEDGYLLDNIKKMIEQLKK